MTFEFALDSLDGLSVGDALGAQFFVPGAELPAPPWEWTDDTRMACSVVAELRERGEIEHRERKPWAGEAFDGSGAVAWAAPLGAFCAGEPERAAALSAGVTGGHPAAVAVAVAASRAAATRERHCAAAELLDAVEPYAIDDVRRARAQLGKTVAAATLGKGARTTVPFTLWAAATFLDDYPAAIVACLDAGASPAAVGGIVAAHTGIRGIPERWRTAREPLPSWVEQWPATLHTRPSTPADGRAVAGWRYPGPWSVYDITEPPTGYTAVTTPDGTLLGFFCTGAEARVPGLGEEPGVTDLGVGMHPRWVGRGHGRAFAEAVLAAVEAGTTIRAVVQEWNARSLRLFANLGFTECGRHEARGVGYRVLVQR